MAYTLSRIDRKTRTYELSATVLAEAAAIPPDLTGVDVALLPPRGAPTAATVWYSAAYDDGSFTVLLAGPDADSTGALVVPASADIWMRIADAPEVDAEKLERIIVLGGGTPLLPATGIPVVSVNGKTGSIISLDADDVGAMAPGDGAGGFLSGSFPNPGVNETALDNAVAALGYVDRPSGGSDGQALIKAGSAVAWGSAGLTAAEIAANATVKAAFAAFSGTVQARWNVRQQANYDRDNALGFNVYVDFVNGNDANTGAHPGQAWKTLGKLTTAGIAAGSRIGLARGSTFTGAYTVPTVTGTLSATNRVVFGAYGLGAAPKITGGTFTIAQPYIDVQDIRFTATSSGYALFIFNGTTTVIGNQVKRCEFDLHTSSGAIIAGIIGGLIEDNYFHDVWNNLEYPSGNGYAMLLTTGSDQTEVRYNLVRNCYKGIGSGNTNRSLNIHHNIIDKCRVNGIDLNGGVLGAPPRVVNNFVWHRPTTPNGHGINTQAGTVGPYWRNNIVVSDYNGPANNVELYCIDSTTYTSTDIDRNLGWIYPGSSGVSYAKLGATNYATLAAYRTALASTSYASKEANSIEADPLLADLAGLVFVPTPASPAINAGVVVPGSTDTYLGSAPDLGAYEVS